MLNKTYQTKITGQRSQRLDPYFPRHLYEYGFKNDKLVLLYEETKNAKIAIKTPNGTTNRENIQNIIMQGTVFGSLICTAVMDKLAQIFYENQDLVYKYKDK